MLKRGRKQNDFYVKQWSAPEFPAQAGRERLENEI
jgi:hypothetical protein